MSDITLDLSGVIALLICMVSAGFFVLAAGVSLVIALARGSGEKGIKQRKSFGFFVTTLPLLIVNLIGFAVLFYTVDSNSHDTNSILDILGCIWFPVQLILWIAAGIVYNRRSRIE